VTPPAVALSPPPPPHSPPPPPPAPPPPPPPRVYHKEKSTLNAADYSNWSYDGSSTDQATGDNSDIVLVPRAVYPDPIRGGDNVLVMCDTYESDGKTPTPCNQRAKAAEVVAKIPKDCDPWYGFEQEYTMMDGETGKVHGWAPGQTVPLPQGPFYCAVGSEAVYGRPLAEAHMDACIKAGLNISGINAEVMPGQWEYQIGPVGPMELGDQTMVSRWLLNRLGEDFGIAITLDPKPVVGDWNGTGGHINFSTAAMRKDGGIKVIEEAAAKLGKRHAEHIAAYGSGNERRLTGKHETASIDTFRSGTADRGASIRIPIGVSLEGKGYLEDRRPSANVNPYILSRMLLETCVLM